MIESCGPAWHIKSCCGSGQGTLQHSLLTQFTGIAIPISSRMSLEFTKVLCLLCFLALVVVEIDSRLCGENLDKVLAVVCDNKFNTMINKKRSHGK